MKNIYILLFIIIYSVHQSFSQEVLIGGPGLVELCEGSFYDNGGASGTYNDNNGNPQVVTICGENGQRAQVTFNSFLLASSPGDFLNIYDGNSTSAPFIGQYTGAIGPGQVAASGSNTSGCLTFEFVPDGIISPLPGWDATISCLAPCLPGSSNITGVSPSTIEGNSYIIYLDNSVDFTSSNNLDDANGLITYEWNFGNGTILEGENVSYTYPNPGNYTVTFTATQNNCDYTNTINVEVQDINEFSLYQQFNGKFDFTAIGNTLTAGQNGASQFCTPLQSSSANLNLEPGQEVEAAFLYWAGSGEGDFDVTLNGQEVSSERNFGVTIVTTGTFPIFGAFADITDVVNATGNGQYTFSDIDLQAGFNTHCGNGLNFGGWSIIVVYEDASLNNNQVSIYDGFRFVSSANPSLTIPLANFEVIDTEGAKVGFLAWEGDQSQPVNESLLFNGTVMSNAINPPNNAFNGTNSYTGETDVYEMDLDFYDISDLIEVGDTDAVVQLTSGQDAIIVHNIVLNINSELPDATVEVDNITGDEICGTNELEVEFTVFNTNSTKELPAGTSVSLYANGEFITTVTTLAAIPIGGSETQTILITIPDNIPEDNDPSDFILSLIVDEEESVDESNDDNNEFFQPIFLTNSIEAPTITPLEDCQNNEGNGVFDLTEIEAEIPAEYNTSYFPTAEDAENGTSEITVPTAYEVNNLQETLYVLLMLENCAEIVPFEIIVFETPQVQNIQDQEQCQIGSEDITFPLELNTPLILGDQDPDTFNVTYYANEAEANVPVNAIANIAAYEPLSNPQQIFIRLENTDHPECYSISSFEIRSGNVFVDNLLDLQECSDNLQGFEEFDLTENTSNALGSQSPDNYTVEYYANLANLNNGIQIPNPEQYNNITNPQSIFIKVQSNLNEDCFATESFVIQTFQDGSLFEEPINLFLCNNGMGNTTVDLSQNTQIISATDSFSVNYFENENDAIAGNNAIVDLVNYVPLNSEQEIFISIKNNTVNSPADCFYITSFILSTTEVIIGEISDKLGCQLPDSEFALFDLTESSTEALSGQSPQDYTVSYYASQADLDNDSPISDFTAYENTVNPQIIYVKVSSDDSPGCFLTTDFEIEATPSAPIFDPSPLFACDTDNDGFFTLFDLTVKDDEVTGGDATVAVSYHLTPSDAELGVDPIQSPYSNISAPTQTVYVRTVDTANGCVQTTTLELQVYDRPMIEEPEGLTACDGPVPDGQANFDLTVVEEEVLDGLDPDIHEVTYHDSEEDAIAGENPFAGPGGYLSQSAGQVVWIRVEDTTTPAGCFSVVPLQLTVSPLPVPVQPAPVEACDDVASGSDTDEQNIFDLTTAEGGITGGDTSLLVNWYESQADLQAGTPIASPSAYQNALDNPQTVIAQVTNAAGCSATVTMTLVVNPLPSPTPSDELDPYQICDDDNDGFAEFDLSTQEQEISNGEADVEITYYSTPQDAQQGLPSEELPNLYTNIQVNAQTIYARSTNTVTGCFRFVELVLETTPLPLQVPTANGQLDLFNCDGDNNNTALFDLTQNNAAIYGGQPVDGYTLTYHESLEDAEDGVDAIGNTAAYSNAGVSPLEIWFRIGDNETGCYRTGSFELIVGGDPQITKPDKLSVCDDSALEADDEIGLFDLTQATPQVTGGDTSLLVEYYATEADLDAGDPIGDPQNYLNIANAQTIQIRVTGENTCPAFTTLTIEVTPNPSLALELEAIEQCDGDNDGFAEFDLEAAIEDILNGEPNVTVTFHITQNAANQGTNPIQDPAQYSTSNLNQTIYVRAENTGPNGDDGTGCSTVRPLQLVRVASPEVQLELEDLYICDDGGTIGLAIFDLTQNQDNILGDLDPEGLGITYHTSEQDAIDGTNAIAVPSMYTNTVNGQVIYVRFEDTGTGCIDTFGFAGDNSFTLNVNELPPLTSPTDLNVCDDDYDNDPFSIALFDLTVKETEIFGGVPVVLPNYGFTYYAGQEDLDNGIAIEDPEAYENTFNPQTIFVVVEDTSSEGATTCSEVVSFDLQVLPLPSPSETDPDVLRQVACDDENDGVAPDPFDLTLSGQLITQGENVTVRYYKTQEGADEEDAAQEIADPTAYTNEPALNEVDGDGNQTNVQVIYARVDSNATGNFCYVVVPFELVVQPEPVLNEDVLNEDVDKLEFGHTLCSDDPAGTMATFIPENVPGQVYDYNGGDFVASDLVPLLDQNTPQNDSIGAYTPSFYFTEADALALENEVPFGEQVSTDQILFIQLTHTLTGCSLTDAADLGLLYIDVQPRPTIDLEPLSLMVCSDLELGNTATVDLTQFDGDIDNNATPPQTEVYYYASEQDYLDGVRIPAANEAAYLVTDGDVVYAEVVDTDTFCSSNGVAVIPVNVDSRPEVDISGFNNSIICVDTNPATPAEGGDYDVLVIDTGLGGQGLVFEWTYKSVVIAGEDGPTLEVGGGASNPLQAGTYTVQAFDTATLDGDGDNCGSDVDTINILESNPPEFSVAPTSAGFAGEHSLVVTGVSGAGDYEFSVDNGPWVDLPSTGQLSFGGLSAGGHIVYGRDRDGCGTTASREVSFIDFPPFFTPNGDGYNDRWNITGLGTDLNQGAQIFIFDRYGKLLKQLSPSAIGWDGTYNGNPLPSGDYWFSVEYLDPVLPGTGTGAQEPPKKTFKNHFTLKR